MFKTLLTFLFSLPALAAVPGNHVTLSSVDASAHGGFPITISRVFAKSEIAHYAQPVVRGAGTPSVWQNDVKTRWRDGLQAATVTASSAASPVEITLSTDAFESGEWISFSGCSTGSGLQPARAYKVVRTYYKHFVLMGSTYGGTPFTGTCAAAGPGPGSMRHALISFLVDVPSTGTQAVDFVDSTDQCSSGGTAACNAAALDGAGMLAFGGGAWAITGTFTNTAVNKTINARTMLTAGNFTYWERGPAKTSVVATDATTARTYDFGWLASQQPSTTKPLHPIIQLSFWTGYAAVRADVILENPWPNFGQDQSYSTVLSNSAGSAYTHAVMTHYTYQRWRKTIWDGTAPTGVKVDLNFPYMIYSRAVPPYKLSLNVSTADSSPPTGPDILGVGWWNQYFPSTGGRHDIGVFPAWYASYLYHFGVNALKGLLLNADMSGSIPIHSRESENTTPARYFIDTNGNFRTRGDSADNFADNYTFGRVISLDARPGNYNTYYTTDNCGVSPEGTTSGAHGWTVDSAHQASFAYLPYLLTGDPYYLDELKSWATYNLFNMVAGDQAYGRMHAFGILTYNLQDRGVAWGIRNIGQAAVSIPDDQSTEKGYFRSKLDNFVQYYDSISGITNGLFNPTTTGTAANPCPNYYTDPDPYGVAVARSHVTPYCFGKNSFDGLIHNSILGLMMPGGAGAEWMLDTAKVDWQGSPWMTAYFVVALGHLVDLGLPVESVLERVSHLPLAVAAGGLSGGTDHNRYLCCSYRTPTIRKVSGVYRSVWSHFDSFAAGFQTKSAWDDSTGEGSSDPSNGYLAIIRGALGYAAPYTFGRARGWQVYDWFWNASNTPYTSYVGFGQTYADPKWGIGARLDPVKQVRATSGDTFVILEYRKPRSDEACTVGGVSDGVTSSRLVRVVKTELTPSSSGTLTISCPSDQFGNTPVAYTTLSTLSGTAAYTWTAAGGNTLLNYGATPALGSSTVFQDCSGRCSATLAKGLWYVQAERQSGAAGEIRPVLVR